MQDRRRFLTLLAATAALPARGQTPSMPPQDKDAADLLPLMKRRLAAELDDPSVAETEAAHLREIGFHWTAPARPASGFKTIVAYSFGNRLQANASPKILPEPGPVNEELADTVHALYQQSHATIYAQWEIARFLQSKHHLTSVVAIEPVVAPDGTITYLSTDGVAEDVIKRNSGKASSLGKVAVVAHRDHAKRCVQTSRARGMDAYVAQGVTLPVTYDPSSGQPWTRRRDLYLIHDMAAQFMQLRAQQIATLFPNG